MRTEQSVKPWWSKVERSLFARQWAILHESSLQQWQLQWAKATFGVNYIIWQGFSICSYNHPRGPPVSIIPVGDVHFMCSNFLFNMLTWHDKINNLKKIKSYTSLNIMQCYTCACVLRVSCDATQMNLFNGSQYQNETCCNDNTWCVMVVHIYHHRYNSRWADIINK